MNRLDGFGQLLAIICLITIVWMFLLPRLAELDGPRRYRERLDAQGIDPAAMYYTELPPHLFADAATSPSLPMHHLSDAANNSRNP